MNRIYCLIDWIAIKWIEWRSNYVRNEMITLYRLAEKRHRRRVYYSYPEEGYVFKVVDECIFCNLKKEIFRSNSFSEAQEYLKQNPLKYMSLVDCEGYWK